MTSVIKKHITILTVVGVLLFFNAKGYAQASSCAEVEPFCAGADTLVFQNTANGTFAEAGPDYGCLNSTPNPAWFYLRIDTGGILNFKISQNTSQDFSGTDLDVDFIAYGPFSDTSQCDNLTAANTIACSFLPDAVENFTISNAVAGQLYILLITNFSENPGWIRLQQTNVGENGAGLTDCSILDSFLGPDIEACVGEVITLDGTTEGATSYRWFVDTGSGFILIPGETNATLNVTTSGTYQVEASDDMNSDTDEVVVTFHELPVINSPITLQQCDDDTDGIANFNLQEAESLITNDMPTPVFTYHLTQADADTNTNAIGNLSSFSNATTNRVYVRVENQQGCYSVAEVNLQVSATEIPSNFMVTFNECDTDLIDGDDTNGITTFDFSSATNSIINQLPPNQNLVVTYYENIADALAEKNELDPSNYRNENSPFSQQIVVRVDNQDNNACIGLGFHVTLRVDPLPEFEIANPQYLCTNLLPDPLTLTVENPQENNYTYEWRDANNNILSPSSAISFLGVTAIGDYFVTASASNNCTRTKKITVAVSNIATIQNIEVVDDSDNNTITVNVTGDGEYEYALDNLEGPYQDSNHFERVLAGIRTVYVRDKHGCGVVSEEVSVIGFPRFFTPNGDGFNDTWQVQGITFQLGSKIFIYDRFGKVLEKLSPGGEGWDGRYRGKPMPADDYWFTVALEDGRLRKGHFSLIRR